MLTRVQPDVESTREGRASERCFRWQAFRRSLASLPSSTCSLRRTSPNCRTYDAWRRESVRSLRLHLPAPHLREFGIHTVV